jgi:hypothetical protein
MMDEWIEHTQALADELAAENLRLSKLVAELMLKNERLRQALETFPVEREISA